MASGDNTTEVSLDNVSQEVVFVLGIMRRSGTNFLSDLLIQHSDCERVRTIWEDFLIANADKLDEFVRGVAGYWSPKWDPDGQSAQQLRKYLGTACISFLASKTREVVDTLPRYIVTKTPSVENLESLSLFPHAKAIVIVRDGRAVVESCMQSFGWDFKTTTYEWARAAEMIVAAKNRDTHFTLVRHEDLVSNLREEMTKIFSLLKIDAESYDFDAAEKLPVRGSSAFGISNRVHWGQVEKTREFKPLERWAEWNAEKHECFNAIAKDQMAYFGYELV